MIQYKLKVELSQEVMLKVNEGDAGAIKQQEVMGALKGGIADKMLERQEENKERFESHKPPKINKGYMEDIKEQDSEQESVRTAKKDSKVVPAPVDGSQVQTKIKQLTEKKQKLQAQLTQMKDSKNVMDLKNHAMAGSTMGGHASTTKEGTFKLYHLIIMAVLGLLLGAYLQKTMFTGVKAVPETAA